MDSPLDRLTPSPKSILVVRTASPTPHVTPAATPGPSPRTRVARLPSVGQHDKAQPNIPRHMLDTSQERFDRAFTQIVLLESDMRQALAVDELCCRGALNCTRVRCSSATRTGRADKMLAALRPHSAALTPHQVGHSNDTGARMLQLRTGAKDSVWTLRRSSAATRRKDKINEIGEQSADADRAAGSAAGAASGLRSSSTLMTSLSVNGAVHVEDDVHAAIALQLRCIAVELSSLAFQYRSQWCEVLFEHADILKGLKVSSDSIRNAWRVLCIQRNYRMHTCRAQFSNIVSCLKVIQRAGRGCILRKALPLFSRQVRGSRLIVAVSNGYAARRAIARQHAPRVRALQRLLATIKIQTAIRGCRARASYWIARRRNRAAVKIQQVVRGMLQRRHHQRREQAYHTTVAQLQLSSSTSELRLVENLFRQQLMAWEYTARAAMMDLAVQHTTAHARVAVALRRKHSPYAPAVSVVVGLLSPSTVGKAEDRWTPRASTLFTAHLPPVTNRPQSSASRRRMAALSAQSATSRKSRDMLELLLVESTEAVERCDVLWSRLAFTNFAVERWLELERRRLTDPMRAPLLLV